MNIFQFKIILQGTNPPIWRRILVKDNINLENLHIIIQTAMGWNCEHLHLFKIEKEKYGDKEGDEFGDILDERKFKLSDLCLKENVSFLYWYDFGDSWKHTVVLEKFLPYEKDKKYPICIAGRKACPPEDCGGIHRFYKMVEILQNPDNEEYNHYVDWLEATTFSKKYDPDYFSLEEANKWY